MILKWQTLLKFSQDKLLVGKYNMGYIIFVALRQAESFYWYSLSERIRGNTVRDMSTQIKYIFISSQ